MYAIDDSNLGKGGRMKKYLRYIDISSDSDDDFQPMQKKKYSASKLDKIASDVDSIKQDLQDVFKVTKDTQCPLGLKKILHDTFICHICRKSPMRPPVIYARCCKRLIGCQSCIDEWYVGSEQSATCPLCRSERAYADTTVLKGIDEFLKAIVSFFSEEDESDS